MHDGNNIALQKVDQICCEFGRPEVLALLREARQAEFTQEWIEAETAYKRLRTIAPELTLPRDRLRALQASDRPDIWRRWISGAASILQGASLPKDAPIAVIVLSFGCQEGLAAAVQALLKQGVPLEITVVNSGGGDPACLLDFARDRIRIINIDEPLYVGAARNIGIDSSAAALIAFLAADCRPRPGWIAARLAVHERGAQAVACAMVPSAQSILVSAEFLCLFGARAPQAPPIQAQRFGASYSRDVFRRFGYFCPTMRTGEDSEFAKRISKTIHTHWAPKAQTEHYGPNTPIAFFIEMFARGQRAAQNQHRRLPMDRSHLLLSLARMALLRTRTSWVIGRDILKWPRGRLALLSLPLALANVVYVAGIGRAVTRLRRVSRYEFIQSPGNKSGALEQVAAAVEEDPENLGLRLRYAEALLALRFEEQALLQIRAAIWLASNNTDALTFLADWLLSRQMHKVLLWLGQVASFCAPQMTSIHLRLAEAAYGRGDHLTLERALFDAVATGVSTDELSGALRQFRESA